MANRMIRFDDRDDAELHAAAEEGGFGDLSKTVRAAVRLLRAFQRLTQGGFETLVAENDRGRTREISLMDSVPVPKKKHRRKKE